MACYAHPAVAGAFTKQAHLCAMLRIARPNAWYGQCEIMEVREWTRPERLSTSRPMMNRQGPARTHPTLPHEQSLAHRWPRRLCLHSRLQTRLTRPPHPKQLPRQRGVLIALQVVPKVRQPWAACTSCVCTCAGEVSGSSTRPSTHPTLPRFFKSLQDQQTGKQRGRARKLCLPAVASSPGSSSRRSP